MDVDKASDGTRWKRKLDLELSLTSEYLKLTREEWVEHIRINQISSANRDTGLALDFPHYCTGATVGCGGVSGWCYTFGGHHASLLHAKKVAWMDVLTRNHPDIFANKVEHEVSEAVTRGLMLYKNLRYAGSGEVAPHHLPALRLISLSGIRLWGFTKRLDMATMLHDIGASVLFSCDKTTSKDQIAEALRRGFGLAYTSIDVEDLPPNGCVVTFPVHRMGRVREIVDVNTVCPKVVDEYMSGSRESLSCQLTCNRCHLLTSK